MMMVLFDTASPGARKCQTIVSQSWTSISLQEILKSWQNKRVYDDAIESQLLTMFLCQ